MSFANYLNRTTNLPQLVQVELTSEPNDLTDSSRVGDSITYQANATYPLTTTSTLTPLETSFVPFFQTGLSAEDYLNVQLPFNPSTLPTGTEELANVEYFMYVLGNSTPRFNIRYAVYDASLNRVQAYDTLLYDPSANPYQSPLISSLLVKGYSVEVPPTAVYGFIEAQNIDGSGSLAVQFAQATNITQLSYNIETAGSSRSSKNIFTLDFGDYNADASGLEPQIQANTSNIVVLQGDVATLDVSVNGLTSSVASLTSSVATKMPLAGGTFTGAVNMGGFVVANGGTPSAPTDLATKSYVDAQTGGGGSGALPLSGGTMTGVINMNGNDITGLPNVPPASSSASSKVYVDTALDGYLPLAGGTMTGSLLMGGSRIQGVATPLLGTDAPNKAYVDSQVATALPLTGGTLTGSLSTPANITCATLNYTTLNPPVSGSAQTLAQVLTTGSDAGNLNITNLNNISLNSVLNPNPINSNLITSPGSSGVYQAQLTPIRVGLKNVFFVDRRPNNVGSGEVLLVLPPAITTYLGTEILVILSSTGNANYGCALKTFQAGEQMYGSMPYVGGVGGGAVQINGSFLYPAGTDIDITPQVISANQNLTGLFANYWGNSDYNNNFQGFNPLVSSQYIFRITGIINPNSPINVPNFAWFVEPVACSFQSQSAPNPAELPNDPPPS
jgi:hypothetical protein